MDFGVKKGLGLKVELALIVHADVWRPWRAYAVTHLWAFPLSKGDVRMTSLKTASPAHTTANLTTGTGTHSPLTRLVKTPLGALHLVSDGESLTGAYFEAQRYFPLEAAEWSSRPETPVLALAARQVDDYFSGACHFFDLPLAASGTDFQLRVWKALREIPHGSVASYVDIARRLGMPHASRAVGAAIGRNPHSLIVPCHRVIGSSGSLTGYAGGLERKRRLLELEGYGAPASLTLPCGQASRVALAEESRP
jgi:O-6-methylguanine DNA methyltransferase